MDGFGYACAVLLAAVFVRAGAAKLARPAQTAGSFVDLGVPIPAASARAVPFVELLVAVALLAAPRVGAVGALVLLCLFTALLVRALRSGSDAPCNCFGTARSDPVSPVDVVRNIFLGVLAALAAVPPRPLAPKSTSAVAAVALFAAGYGALAALRRRWER